LSYHLDSNDGVGRCRSKSIDRQMRVVSLQVATSYFP
jgi:hypothetical protein